MDDNSEPRRLTVLPEEHLRIVETEEVPVVPVDSLDDDLPIR